MIEMMNKKILILLLVGIFVFSGCISGSISEKVNADGSIHRLISIDKMGMLANASCDTLKNMAQNSGEADQTTISSIDTACRETDSQLIIEHDSPPNQDGNPVKIIEKSDGKYLHYEDKATPAGVSIVTTVSMPSKVTYHNGKLIDDYTIEFRGATSLMDQDSNSFNIVESRVPVEDFTGIALIVGGILGLGAIAAVVFWPSKKKR